MPNHWQIVPVVLSPNHWQTVDLGFEAQPRNPCYSSPRARCRPHTTSSNLSIVWSLSTRSVRPSPIICTRSPTSAMILVAARHATPSSYTPWGKQMRFFKGNKDKSKPNETSWIQIQTSLNQWLITIKPRNWPLGFSEYIIQPPDWCIGHLCQCSRQKIKMYTRLPTYKIVVVDRCSRNLELLCRLSVAVYMSPDESLRLLQKAPPKLGKDCAGL
jgi:hypothetical protein